MALSTAYKRYALAVITAIYTLNLVDRMLVMLLLQPIKQDLHLSDSQLGFLTGIAFGLFYATLGVPLARWADRGNRVTIASLAIGLWGFTVMACLFVTSYVQLVFARMAAAVGESGCKPPTYSLVGDYFPAPVERTRAMSIYWLGSPISALFAFITGGWLNELYGWRMTFFLVGIPGLVLALVAKLTLIEPRKLTGQTVRESPLPPIREVFLTLWRQRAARRLSIALVLLYTISLGLAPWYAAFMIRSHGMSTRELGTWLGLIIGICGIVGILLGGYVASRWFANNERGQLRVTAISVASLFLCFIAFLTVPQKHLALFAFMPLMVVLNFFLAPTYAVLQRLVLDHMRATTMAVVMLLANLIGMGLGPQIVGILSDAFAPTLGNDSLRYAMLGMSTIALCSAWYFWNAGRTVEEDLAGLAAREASARTSRTEHHSSETAHAERYPRNRTLSRS